MVTAMTEPRSLFFNWSKPSRNKTISMLVVSCHTNRRIDAGGFHRSTVARPGVRGNHLSRLIFTPIGRARVARRVSKHVKSNLQKSNADHITRCELISNL